MASSTFVIAMAGHSGAGKSTVIENVVSQSGNANLSSDGMLPTEIVTNRIITAIIAR